MSDDIQRTLGRIESKLDAVIKDRDEDKNRLDNHGNRIGALERWQARVVGAVAIVAFGLGLAVKVLR
jgi:hypothetical protein